MTDPAARFVPPDLDAGDFANLRPLFEALQARDLDSARAVERWLTDASDLLAVISEYGSRRQIEHGCHTDDPALEKRYLDFVQDVAPKVKPAEFALEQKLLACPHAAGLPADRYEVLLRQWRADVEIYRDANVPLQTEVTKLTTQYNKLCGAMTVEFRGKTYTLQQLGRFLEDPDRPTREEAWKLSWNRRLADRAKMDELFDQLMSLRRQIAANADLPDYRAYVWKSHYRTDYTPEDCAAFADAVQEVCVPATGRMQAARREALRLETLRPWDLAVDVKNRPALAPFAAEKPTELVSRTREVFQRLSPPLAELFDQLEMGRNLDLDSRPGKRPGGFQASLEVVKQPFIFMNAAGLHRDVETLLHEAGHAFHYMDSRALPLLFVRHAPLEFCEVASMSMELLGLDHMGVFYNSEDAGRARRSHLEGVIGLLPWIATVDSFQHWLYRHPQHTVAERTAAWLDIYQRFSPREVDWSGFEEVQASRWQAQLHIYNYPFYYIEYGIAQLGALQVWQRYRQDPADTIGRLRRAFALGGTRPLPDLFNAAGIRFDFSAATLRPLIDMVNEELDRLPV